MIERLQLFLRRLSIGTNFRELFRSHHNGKLTIKSGNGVP
jgi:hypothetical protein